MKPIIYVMGNFFLYFFFTFIYLEIKGKVIIIGRFTKSHVKHKTKVATFPSYLHFPSSFKPLSIYPWRDNKAFGDNQKEGEKSDKVFSYHASGGGRGFRIGSGGGFDLFMRILPSGFLGSFGLAS